MVLATQILHYRGRPLWLQRCNFWTVKKSFLLTTAAQNMHGLLRKLPLRRKYFFAWLKTAISSTACGTSTLKSPLLRAFSVPDVHPRLRKRPPRCTLDCGFKTPESPALRGFVAERCPTTGTSLYLVLKSNGLPRPKIRLKKFGFSSKSVPANIAKKLPPQRCPKPFLIPFFNFSRKRPTFAFAGECGYTHSALLKGSHTTAHTAKQGCFGWEVVSLPSERSARSQASPARVSERQTLPLLGLGRVYSRRTQRAFGTAMRLCASLFRGVAALLGCVIFIRVLIAPLVGSVANFPALWYDKFNKLESVMH